MVGTHHEVDGYAMAIPMIIMALAIASLLGGGLKNVVIALGFGLIPGYARLMCSQVLVV
jgi:peptide/nickel transport system permease protein